MIGVGEERGGWKVIGVLIGWIIDEPPRPWCWVTAGADEDDDAGCCCMAFKGETGCWTIADDDEELCTV